MQESLDGVLCSGLRGPIVGSVKVCMPSVQVASKYHIVVIDKGMSEFLA